MVIRLCHWCGNEPWYARNISSTALNYHMVAAEEAISQGCRPHAESQVVPLQAFIWFSAELHTPEAWEMKRQRPRILFFSQLGALHGHSSQEFQGFGKWIVPEDKGISMFSSKLYLYAKYYEIKWYMLKYFVKDLTMQRLILVLTSWSLNICWLNTLCWASVCSSCHLSTDYFNNR